jgi:hypothetical protein
MATPTTTTTIPSTGCIVFYSQDTFFGRMKRATWKIPYEYVSIVFLSGVSGSPTVMIATMDDTIGLVVEPFQQFLNNRILIRVAYRPFLGHPQRLLEGLQKHMTRPCAATSDKAIAHILGCEYRTHLATAGTAVTNIEFAALVLEDARVTFSSSSPSLSWVVDNDETQQFRVEAPPLLAQQIFSTLGVFRGQHIEEDDTNATDGNWQILRLEHFLRPSTDLSKEMFALHLPQWTQEERDSAVRKRFERDAQVASKFLGSFFSKTIAEQWLYRRVGEDITVADTARRTQNVVRKELATEYLQYSLTMIHRLINEDAYYPTQTEMTDLQTRATALSYVFQLQDTLDESLFALPTERILEPSTTEEE